MLKCCITDATAICSGRNRAKVPFGSETTTMSERSIDNKAVNRICHDAANASLRAKEADQLRRNTLQTKTVDSTAGIPFEKDSLLRVRSGLPFAVTPLLYRCIGKNNVIYAASLLHLLPTRRKKTRDLRVNNNTRHTALLESRQNRGPHSLATPYRKQTKRLQPVHFPRSAHPAPPKPRAIDGIHPSQHGMRSDKRCRLA